MACHSHWATIKHKKALVDKKRGKLWSKISKSIIVAAKMGGGDPEMNIRLRAAIDDARKVSMPKDNIERAIKRGTGEIEGNDLEESLYEGYGPNGAAVICQILTDNRNRTAPEIRKIFDIADGKLGGSGCVAWMFDRKGIFTIPVEGCEEDALMETALEAGADDVRHDGDYFTVICPPDLFSVVNAVLEQKGFKPEIAELNYIANTTVEIDVETGRKMLRLMEMLDEHDDVQKVASNFSLTPEAMQLIAAEA